MVELVLIISWLIAQQTPAGAEQQTSPATHRRRSAPDRRPPSKFVDTRPANWGGVAGKARWRTEQARSAIPLAKPVALTGQGCLTKSVVAQQLSAIISETLYGKWVRTALTLIIRTVSTIS